MNTGKRVVWHTPKVSSDGLKNFACVMMLLQTIGIAVVEHGMLKTHLYTQEQFSMLLSESPDKMMLAGVGSVLQLLGGMAVPLFAWLLVEGFLYTSDVWKYLLRLLFFAVVSEVPYDLVNYGRCFDIRGQNALFSMCISLMMLYFLRMLQERGKVAGILLKALVILAAIVWASVFRTGYGLCVILLSAVFYLLYRANILKTILGILISLLYVTGPLAFYGIWCCSEERTNRLPKYSYYLFYPIHLLAAWMIGGLF